MLDSSCDSDSEEESLLFMSGVTTMSEVIPAKVKKTSFRSESADPICPYTITSLPERSNTDPTEITNETWKKRKMLIRKKSPEKDSQSKFFGSYHRIYDKIVYRV